MIGSILMTGRLTLPDLVPTIGLWWYFFTEIFDTFRNFFLGVFQLHMVVYVVPLCIKIRYVTPESPTIGG